MYVHTSVIAPYPVLFFQLFGLYTLCPVGVESVWSASSINAVFKRNVGRVQKPIPTYVIKTSSKNIN